MMFFENLYEQYPNDGCLSIVPAKINKHMEKEKEESKFLSIFKQIKLFELDWKGFLLINDIDNKKDQNINSITYYSSDIKNFYQLNISFQHFLKYVKNLSKSNSSVPKCSSNLSQTKQKWKLYTEREDGKFANLDVNSLDYFYGTFWQVILELSSKVDESYDYQKNTHFLLQLNYEYHLNLLIEKNQQISTTIIADLIEEDFLCPDLVWLSIITI